MSGRRRPAVIVGAFVALALSRGATFPPATRATQAVVRGMRDISGITEIFALRKTADRYRYELVATMAGPPGPDLVGLLADGFGFGRIGDHGGAQELVQRIPMIIHVPGEAPSTRARPLRLMDLAPEISRVLGRSSLRRGDAASSSGAGSPPATYCVRSGPS